MADSILQRVAAGDAAAVQQCIDRYSGLVWTLARKFCRQQADAEDAVQEIFISVWDNARRFDGSVASEATFVAMIARRRLIDRHRRQMRMKETASLSESMLQPVHGRQGSLELSDEAAQVSGFLTQIKAEHREVLELALVYGKTYEEISLATRLPLGTVKTHARRGLMRVRELLKAAGSAGTAPASGTAAEVSA